MRIAIGADHAGFAPQRTPEADARALGHAVDDHGTTSEASGRTIRRSASRVGRAVADGEADRGIVLGGSGQGEQIAANKVAGVRAALCNDLYTARLSREHNDANVLSMGGRIVAFGLADEILDALARPPPSRAGATSAASIRSAARTQRLTERNRNGDDSMAPKTTPLMWRTLAEPDPDVAQPIRDELHRQNSGLELIASENFVSRADSRSGRLGVHEQVRRRLSRQALLRRLRVRRRRRVARHRARQGSCSAPNTPTCSRTRARRRTWRST